MIEVSCYNCGSAHHTLYATENGCSLVKCTGCGLLYVNPRPSDQEIDESVKVGAHKGEQTLNSTGHYMATKVAIYRKVLIDIYGMELQGRKRTWLDIGCGHGELLVALQKLCKGNVVAKGIEPNRHKIAAARKRGLDVGYFDLASHDEQYDSISLLNVYSHLTNPPEFLRLVRQRLRPKGEVLLQTGDTASLPVDKHPRPFRLPDELSFASEQILLRMLRQCGFEIISVNKYPAIKLRFMKSIIVKRILKFVLTHKSSQLTALYTELRAAKYQTDMWIRARAAV